jgi:hypothetical protein
MLETDLRLAEAAAYALGIQTLRVLQASTERDLDSVFANLSALRADGIVINADTFFSGKSAELAALTLRHAIPAVSPYREFARAGGLMSYGVNITQLYRLVGVHGGLSGISCAGPVDHYAVTNLPSKMTANWVLASHHSRGGIFHSAATSRKMR